MDAQRVMKLALALHIGISASLSIGWGLVLRYREQFHHHPSNLLGWGLVHRFWVNVMQSF